MDKKIIYIYGKNAVLEALRNKPETIERVFVERDRAVPEEILELRTILLILIVVFSMYLNME